MAIQKLELFAWGLIKRQPVDVPPGTEVKVGVDVTLSVLAPDKVQIIQTNAEEWEGFELKNEVAMDEINARRLQAEGGLLDLFTGHKVLFQWTPR